MTDKGLVRASLVLAIGMVASAGLSRFAVPRSLTIAYQPQAAGPQFSREVKLSLVQQFIDEVTTKTPELGDHQAITSVDVVAMSLSDDGTTLTIVPRVFWTRQDSPTHFPCTLRADGFGGFVGKYSPVSHTEKMIYVELSTAGTGS